jgi:UDP:flavonoid glycosyltransferase YjiC (YdhE family)
MARILIGWEFGANRGHATRLTRLAGALRAGGHEVAFALQRLDAIDPGEAGGAAVWQAPVSPRLLRSVPHRRPEPMAGMADILARLGMDEPSLVAAVVRGWRQLLGATRPDVVIAEFAPFLLLAAGGRVPTIALGTGFTLPPATMPAFPRLVDAAGTDQARLLETVNAGLAATGAEPLAALPGMFAADRAAPATFTELDPYADQRREPLARPLPADFGARAGDGDEIFVYAPETIAVDAALWAGLAESRLPVRVHVPRADARLRARLTGLGLGFEPEPLPFARIAERSRLLLSHGGHDFLCAGLAAGLPQVVFHYDLEKLCHGLAVARAGLGGHVPLAAIEPAAFAASLVRLHGDAALAARSRSAAAGFLDGSRTSIESAVAQAVIELA